MRGQMATVIDRITADEQDVEREFWPGEVSVSPRAYLHPFLLRAFLLFAPLTGIAYGVPVPLDWTGLPTLLRGAERFLTHHSMAPGPSALYAPPDAISPLFLLLIVAAPIALAWTLLDRARRHELQLQESLFLIA